MGKQQKSRPKQAAPGRSIVAPPFVFPKPTPKPLPAVVPSEDPPPGLECARCGCHHFNTLHTTKAPGFIRRRKECRHCGWRTMTVETIATHKQSWRNR